MSVTRAKIYFTDIKDAQGAILAASTPLPLVFSVVGNLDDRHTNDHVSGVVHAKKHLDPVDPKGVSNTDTIGKKNCWQLDFNFSSVADKVSGKEFVLTVSHPKQIASKPRPETSASITIKFA